MAGKTVVEDRHFRIAARMVARIQLVLPETIENSLVPYPERGYRVYRELVLSGEPIRGVRFEVHPVTLDEFYWLDVVLAQTLGECFSERVWRAIEECTGPQHRPQWLVLEVEHPETPGDRRRYYHPAFLADDGLAQYDVLDTEEEYSVIDGRKVVNRHIFRLPPGPYRSTPPPFDARELDPVRCGLVVSRRLRVKLRSIGAGYAISFSRMRTSHADEVEASNPGGGSEPSY